MTGTFTPTVHRTWLVNQLDIGDCECRIDEMTLHLRSQGQGRARSYSVVDAQNSTLAYSEHRRTTGIAATLSEELRFLEASSGRVIAAATGWNPPAIRIGQQGVPYTMSMRRWFQYVIESPYFEFAFPFFKATVSFRIGTPDVVLPSLCIGYLLYVRHTEEDGSCSTGAG